MQNWLSQGVSDDNLQLADHSGLSSDNLMTARSMALLLAGPGRSANLAALMKKDPLAEDPGAAAHAKIEVAAKTGTLNFVSNLAGYVTSPEGQQLAFAIFCTDPIRHAASIGQELPPGMATWTRNAKKLQRQLIESWS